jgi:DNA-directed RNA polymerase subunit omega
MARVTVEDCLINVDNRYELVHLCVRRARQLYRGADRLVHCKNNEVVTALREIASGKVRSVKLAPPAAVITDESNLTQ